MGSVEVQGKPKLWPVVVKFTLSILVISCAAFAFQSGLVYLELALGWISVSDAGQVLAMMIVCILCFWYFIARTGGPYLTRRMAHDKRKIADTIKTVFEFGIFMFAVTVMQLVLVFVGHLGGIDGVGQASSLSPLLLGAVYGFLGFFTP